MIEKIMNYGKKELYKKGKHLSAWRSNLLFLCLTESSKFEAEERVNELNMIVFVGKQSLLYQSQYICNTGKSSRKEWSF